MTPRLSLSLTETPQYRRLVQFIGEVSEYAQETNDAALADIVERLRADLMAMVADDGDD